MNADSLPFLTSDEFVIIKDESNHLIQGCDQQINLTPATLFLTNRKVYVQPLVDGVNPAEIALEEINRTDQTETNDCLVLRIIGEKSRVTIFVPDNEHQQSFGELVTKLAVAAKSGQIDCDSLSLSLQRRFIEAKSLSQFYQLFKADKDNLVDEPTFENNCDTLGVLQHINPTPVRVIDVFADLIELSEFLPFALLISTVALLSLIFHYVPPGVCLCGSIFLAVMRIGFKLIFSKSYSRKQRREMKLLNAKIAKRFKNYAISYETFTNTFRKRFMWRNPRQTLETAVFMLSTAIMFWVCDPAFVLFISMIGLSYVERWNPFGFGSISEIFSNLFQF